MAKQQTTVLAHEYATISREEILARLQDRALAIVDVSLVGMRVMHVDWMTGWTQSIAQTGLAGGVNDYHFTGPYRDEIMDLKMLLISLPISARTIQLAIGTVALVFTLSYFRSTWRTARTDRSELLALGTLCAISLLPIYHRVYDATILTIALAWILSELNGANWRFALTMLVPLTIFVIPFDVVGSAAKRVEFIAQISQTDWWQSILAPHYAWGLFAGTAFLLGALGRQAAMNRGDHRAFTYQIYRAMMRPRELWEADVIAFAEQWEEWKQASDYIDYTDMIEIALREIDIAPNDPKIGFFDETQDFTPLELALVRKWGDSMEYIVLAGWPVQFLPPTGPLVEEALCKALTRDVEGVPARALAAEHLAAIALQTGRAKYKACPSIHRNRRARSGPISSHPRQARTNGRVATL